MNKIESHVLGGKLGSNMIDRSWILPIFNHDLYIFLVSFLCIWTLFRVITGVQVLTWGKWCIWGDLESLWQLCWKRQNIDRRLPIIIDGRKVLSIDRHRNHPRVNDKLEDCKFQKSSNYYILSLWPPVRLYY